MSVENLDNKIIEELNEAFDEIQMPRTPYMLKNFVVGGQYTESQMYAQCVLEMSIAYDNLRTAKIHAELKQMEIDDCKKSLFYKFNKKKKLEIDIKKIELEQLNRARLGALREFEFLFSLWKSSEKKYTREELNQSQEEYWVKRLSSQANRDLLATGRVGQGNQESLGQIGLAPMPELNAIREVEKKYLETGKQKMLIAVPTEHKAENGLPCIEGLIFPSGVQTKILNVWGRKVDDAYNYAAMEAVKDNADWLLTVEDDTLPPKDVIVKLIELARSNRNSAVGAWYPKREISLQGVHITIKNGERTFLEDDGNIHEVYTLAMGCSLYPVGMFIKIPHPWFMTTDNLSQDSFFSQLARDNGYKLLVDTSIKCKHVDRVTKDIFISGEIIPQPMQVKEELDKVLELAKNKKLILEIGTSRGGSLYPLLKNADDNAEVISIDLPDGKFGGEFGLQDESVMQSWKRNGQKLHIIRGDSSSSEVVDKVKSIINGKKFDFVFVDGDHTYSGVKLDYLTYKEYTNGMMAFHDIAEHSNNPDVGVNKFWKELSGNKTEIIEDTTQGWAGIGVIELHGD